MNPPLPPRVIFSSLFKPRLDIFPVFGKIVAVVVVACERFWFTLVRMRRMIIVSESPPPLRRSVAQQQ